MFRAAIVSGYVDWRSSCPSSEDVSWNTPRLLANTRCIVKLGTQSHINQMDILGKIVVITKMYQVHPYYHIDNK
jgi:hypothetical protein